MPFTGKATYAAGADLPEIAEDVSDIIGIVSPFETPLLDHLGDAKGAARSTVHEWLEDSLLPNTDAINQTTFSPSPTTATSITVNNGARFQVGDQVKPGTTAEVMLVTAVATNTLTVTRGYGGTTAATLTNGMAMLILGNAALDVVRRPKREHGTQSGNRPPRSRPPGLRGIPRAGRWRPSRGPASRAVR